MRRIVAMLLAGAGAAGLASGCGATEDPAAAAEARAAAPAGLHWSEPPLVFAPKGATDTRIASGELRNDTGRTIELRVDRMLVRDATGATQPGNGRFVQAFGHGLYGPGGPPAPLRASRYDQARLGERVALPDGASRPIVVAWRQARGAAPAVALVLGDQSLRLP